MPDPSSEIVNDVGVNFSIVIVRAVASRLFSMSSFTIIAIDVRFCWAHRCILVCLSSLCSIMRSLLYIACGYSNKFDFCILRLFQ